MTLFNDLLRASALSLVLGISFNVLAVLAPIRPWTSMSYLGLGISVGAGVVLLARGRRDRIIPIAAVYVVLMTAVLLFVNFLIAWRLGRVEM